MVVNTDIADPLIPAIENLPQRLAMCPELKLNRNNYNSEDNITLSDIQENIWSPVLLKGTEQKGSILKGSDDITDIDRHNMSLQSVPLRKNESSLVKYANNKIVGRPFSRLKEAEALGNFHRAVPCRYCLAWKNYLDARDHPFMSETGEIQCRIACTLIKALRSMYNLKENFLIHESSEFSQLSNIQKSRSSCNSLSSTWPQNSMTFNSKLQNSVSDSSKSHCCSHIKDSLNKKTCQDLIVPCTLRSLIESTRNYVAPSSASCRAMKLEDSELVLRSSFSINRSKSLIQPFISLVQHTPYKNLQDQRNYFHSHSCDMYKALQDNTEKTSVTGNRMVTML